MHKHAGYVVTWYAMGRLRVGLKCSECGAIVGQDWVPEHIFDEN